MVRSQLNNKLIRDLLSLKAQVFSIGLVVGLGVAVLFGFNSTHRSLETSRDLFFQEANFAELFVDLKKAPLYAAKEMESVNGVAKVETRLTYDALLSLPKFIEPAVGHFVSIPDGAQPQFNQLHIKKGRLPSGISSEEVVVSEGFFEAHQLQLGDSFHGTLNGRKKRFQIVGVGVTPEYIIALQGGSPLPDDLHFTVVWVNQSVLAGSYDMRASFNSALIRMKAGAQKEKVIYDLDEIIDRYGGVGVYGRDKQISSVFLNEELKQLEVQAKSIPFIFFLVAAFILNVVISRLVAAQRSEIATLKAVGYFDKDISFYYLKISAMIVLVGALVGVFFGSWIGQSMIDLYGIFYRIPVLKYDFSYDQIIVAIAIALVTATLGVYSALKNIFKLQPAEAMRPPAPPSFHGSFFESRAWFQAMGSRLRMIVRGLSAFPKRALMTGLGMSLSIVLLVSGLFWSDSVDLLLLAQYTFVQKETGTIQLTQAVSPSAAYEIERFEGVLEAEAYRVVGAKARFQNREVSTALKGIPENSRLQEVVNEKLETQYLPSGGIYISRILANQLEIKVGDSIEVELLEGRRPKINLEVGRIVDSFMSPEIITSRRVIADLLNSDDLVNQILFRSYAGSTELYTKIKEVPRVLTITYRDGALKVFSETNAKFLLVFSFILTLFAGAIGFGITYNNMRVTLAERDWELATLRILGFKTAEAFKILISEIVFLLLCFLPVGWVLGYLNAKWLISVLSMDAFQIPFVIKPLTFFIASMTLVVSAILSSWFIYRRIKAMDLVATLKARG